MVVWWGTEVECVSAIARRRRSNALTQDLERDAIDRLRHLSRSWKEIDPAPAIRETAIRLLRTHDLRAADALQLAAAFAAHFVNPFKNLELIAEEFDGHRRALQKSATISLLDVDRSWTEFE